MRIRMVAALVGVLWAGFIAGAARADLAAPNALGLYFDAEAVSSQLTLHEMSTVDAYLVYTDPTITALTGWEAKVTASGGAYVSAVSLPVGATALQNGPEDFAVTLSSPMPCNPLTKLAVFTFTVQPGQTTGLYLGNIDAPSSPGSLPAVQLEDGTWTGVPLVSGDPSQPVASIDTLTPVAATGWGDVKALFR